MSDVPKLRNKLIDQQKMRPIGVPGVLIISLIVTKMKEYDNNNNNTTFV